MKPITYIIINLTALCVAEGLHAQNTAPVGVTPPPPATISATTPLPPAEPDAPGTSQNFIIRTQPSGPTAILSAGQPAAPGFAGQSLPGVQAQVEQAQAEADRARVAVDQATALINDIGAGGENPFGVTWNSFYPAARTEGARALVIRTSEADAKTLANTEEDLNIMARILEKAISQSADEQPKAMGIPVLAVSGRKNVRNFQIEGFGAIFMLKVNFPLLGPATRSEDGANKEPSNSTWDEAKREIYGPPPGAEGRPDGALYKEEYDPKRVEKLKDSLIEALKNASNMRNLKSDENVIVVVTSGEGGQPRMEKMVLQERLMALDRAGGVGTVVPDNKSRTPKYVRVNRETDGSVLTIRAKKSDIDAYAGGKLNTEEFRNKIKMLVY